MNGGFEVARLFVGQREIVARKARLMNSARVSESSSTMPMSTSSSAAASRIEVAVFLLDANARPIFVEADR